MFGSIVNGEMILNDAGQMIDSVCIALSNVIPGVELEPYIIMPNHFHAVVIINSNSLSTRPHKFPEEGRLRPKDLELEVSRISLPQVVQRFKSITTRRYIDGVEKYDWPGFDQRLWQRNYYEHVIRDEVDYEEIADYILVNPQNWEKDSENI